MRKSFKISVAGLLLSVPLSSTPGCAVKKVSTASPKVAFQTATYVVVETSPDSFTVITRSKAAIKDVTIQLGCNQQHPCASEWDGEVWTIQRLK